MELAGFTRSLGEADRARIEGLVRAVRGEPRAAQPWWALLQFAERCEVPHTGYRDGLLKLYETATKTAPKAFADNNVSSAFVRMWLGYAQHQTHEDDKRHTYKTMRDMRIGTKSSLLYTQWAEFELSVRNPEKAAAVVRKGVAEKAQPLEPLLGLQRTLQQAQPPRLPGRRAEGGAVGGPAEATPDQPRAGAWLFVR